MSISCRIRIRPPYTHLQRFCGKIILSIHTNNLDKSAGLLYIINISISSSRMVRLQLSELRNVSMPLGVLAFFFANWDTCFQLATKSGQPLRVQNQVLTRTAGFAPVFLLPENQKGRKIMLTKTTFTCKPVPAATISRLSGTTEISINKEPHPSVNGAAWENQPFMGACVMFFVSHMVRAQPILRIVTAEVQVLPIARVTPPRTWEAPTAKWPRVNRRDIPPAPIRGSGVITHQCQFHK